MGPFFNPYGRAHEGHKVRSKKTLEETDPKNVSPYFH